jgi:hypothetical protein
MESEKEEEKKRDGENGEVSISIFVPPRMLR